MNALQVMDRYRKEVKQASKQENVIKVQYLYDTVNPRSRTQMSEELKIGHSFIVPEI